MGIFGEKIKKLLRDNGYTYKVCGRQFVEEGVEYEDVHIYSGKHVTTVNDKRSRKLVAWKNQNGEWEGDKAAINNCATKGTLIYEVDYHEKTIPVKITLYSDVWETDQKAFGDQEKKLLQKLAGWDEKTLNNL